MASDDDISINTAPDSGAPPPPLPPLEVAGVAAAGEVSFSANSAENYYNNEGCCLKVLAAMCHGLRDDNCNPLLPLEGDPWKSFPLTQIRPNKDTYAKEVIRRWSEANSGRASAKVGPRPRAWNLPKIHEWLDLNPIVDPSDVAFLTATVASQKEVAEAARKEDDDDNARLGAGNWNSTACM